VILARTRKGRGFDEVEDRENWHGKPLPEPMAERAIIELGGQRDLRVTGLKPEGGSPRAWPSAEVSLPQYGPDDKVATRLAFGQALAAVFSQLLEGSGDAASRPERTRHLSHDGPPARAGRAHRGSPGLGFPSGNRTADAVRTASEPVSRPEQQHAACLNSCLTAA